MCPICACNEKIRKSRDITWRSDGCGCCMPDDSVQWERTESQRQWCRCRTTVRYLLLLMSVFMGLITPWHMVHSMSYSLALRPGDDGFERGVNDFTYRIDPDCTNSLVLNETAVLEFLLRTARFPIGQPAVRSMPFVISYGCRYDSSAWNTNETRPRFEVDSAALFVTIMGLFGSLMYVFIGLLLPIVVGSRKIEGIASTCFVGVPVIILCSICVRPDSRMPTMRMFVSVHP